MRRRHEMLESPALGRKAHVWCYGHFGPPLIAFPTAAGFAHEWQHQGMVEALSDLIGAGKLKLYCPETNISRSWLGDGPAGPRLAAHQAYERFVLETLVPFVERDCRAPGIPIELAGASLGALYAGLFALKHPRRFRAALLLSGRYLASHFLGPCDDPAAYFDNPLAFVPNLHGAPLDAVRQTHLTLVCGQGPYEEGCIEETRALAGHCRRLGIPHIEDIWGHDVAHDWIWWRRQARYHLTRRLG